MTGYVYLLTKDQRLIKEVENSLPENVELTISDEAKSAKGADAVLLDVDRSEERRVGKECRL